MKTYVLVLLGIAAIGLRFVASLSGQTAMILDPLLIVAIFAALPGRPVAAIVAGLLTGFADDVWTGRWFGMNAFSHMTVAYILALAAARMDMFQTIPVVVALALGTTMEWALHIGLMGVFGRKVGAVPGPVWWGASVVANVLLGTLLFRMVRGGKRR